MNGTNAYIVRRRYLWTSFKLQSDTNNPKLPKIRGWTWVHRRFVQNVAWEFSRNQTILVQSRPWARCVALRASLHASSGILELNTNFGDCICSQRRVWATFSVEFPRQSRSQPLDRARQHSNTQWAVAVLTSTQLFLLNQISKYKLSFYMLYCTKYTRIKYTNTFYFYYMK
jgi:hypothetical protein